MLFFMIKVFIFSQIFSVLGLANDKIGHRKDEMLGMGYGLFSRNNDFLDFEEYAKRQEETVEILKSGPDNLGKFYDATIKFSEVEVPGEEYEKVGITFISNFLNVLRVSMGDFDFSAIGFLTDAEFSLFWVVWLAILVSSNIIFLNFIIAEASASYENVKENLDAEVYKSRAKLISEAQFMTFKSSKNSKIMPQYIIIREADT